jgi:hypothetical protein
LSAAAQARKHLDGEQVLTSTWLTRACEMRSRISCAIRSPSLTERQRCACRPAVRSGGAGD